VATHKTKAGKRPAPSAPSTQSGAHIAREPTAPRSRVRVGVKVVAAVCLAGLAAILATSFFYRVERPTLVVKTVRENPHQAPGGMGGMGGAMGGAMGGSGETPPAMAEMIEMMSALKEKPNDFDLLMRLGERFLTMEFAERAVIFFERAEKVKPDDPDMLNALGVAYFQSNAPERAKEKFDRLLALDKNDYRAHYNLGILLGHSLNDPSGAKAHFAAVIASPAAPEQTKEQARREIGQ